MKFFLFIIFMYCNVVLAEEGKNVPSVHINCTDDDHCGDFRMVCSKNQKCICSRFYDWDESLKQCSLNLPEIGLWLDSMKEEKDLREELDKEADQVFKQLAFAGISAILTGLFGGLTCVYCFCIKDCKIPYSNASAEGGQPASKTFSYNERNLSQILSKMKPPSMNIDDIESRIIILKRRAAEANFLREERDMLLNRLKLYSNDYDWPESSGEMFTEETRLQNESYKKLKEENESLTKENEFLNNELRLMHNEMMNLESLKKDFEIIREENEVIKDELDKMASLEKDVQHLLEEKEELNADLQSVLAVTNSDDPTSYYKSQIKRLLNRVNKIKKEKENLNDLLLEKVLKIDILLGKISHLEARLNEKYISTKLKVQLGDNLEPEETLLWTVHKLETANRTMGNDLSELTNKFDAMNDKYKELLLQTKKKGLLQESPLLEHHASKKYPLDSDVQRLRILSERSYHELEKIINNLSSGKKLETEAGSTGPSSPVDSQESLDNRRWLGIEEGCEKLLATLYSSTKSVNKYDHLLTEMRRKMKEVTLLNRPLYKCIYSDVENPEKPYLRIGSSIIYSQVETDE